MPNNKNTHVVYAQYWIEARHCEKAKWMFNSIYAVITAALFGIFGSDLSIEIKASFSFFGIILSILGFTITHSFHLPYFTFVTLSEVIAIKEFKLKDEYRRYFRKESESIPNKLCNLNDHLAVFHSIIIAFMIFALISIYSGSILIAITFSVLSGEIFLLFHLLKLRKTYIRVWEENRKIANS